MTFDEKSMRSLVLVLICFYSAFAQSTPQVLDELSYEGEVHQIFEFPLEGYFEKQQSYPNMFSSEGIKMSANWRGHRATWEIRNEMLLLTGVLKLYGDPRDSKMWEWKDIMRVVFPGQSQPILASWYTGDIRIPTGKQVKCFALAYGLNDREKEIQIRIEDGIVARVETRLNERRPVEPCD